MYTYHAIGKSKRYDPLQQTATRAERHAIIKGLQSSRIMTAQLQDIDPDLLRHNAAQQILAQYILGYAETPRRDNKARSTHQSRTWNLYGAAYLEHQQLPQAARCFREAVKDDPQCAPAWNNLGTIHLQIGDLTIAQQHFQQAIASDPTLDIAYGNAALAAMETGSYEKARQYISQAIRLDPSEPMHHNTLGILCLTLGFTENAVDCFNQALRANPRLPMPYYNRGRAYRQIDDYVQSNADFDLAEKLEYPEFNKDSTAA